MISINTIAFSHTERQYLIIHVIKVSTSQLNNAWRKRIHFFLNIASRYHKADMVGFHLRTLITEDKMFNSQQHGRRQGAFLLVCHTERCASVQM